MCDLKVGVFGSCGSEKRELELRFLTGQSSSSYIPKSEDEFSKVIKIDNKTINLSLIDTSDQDNFSEMRYAYYNKIQAAILVFDISNPQSIEEIKTIYQEIKESDADNIIIAIAANRGYLRDNHPSDLIPVDRYSEIEKYFKCKLFETNTKTGQNVDELFKYIINQYLATMKKEQFPNEKKQRNIHMLESSKMSMTSNDLVKKRSTSLFWKKSSNNNSTTIDNSNSTGQIFASPMGAEIKSILQSRTKQLQQALEDKKELEKIIEKKDEELKRAYERIDELEKELCKDKSKEEKKDKKKHSKSEMRDYDKKDKKKSRKRTKTTGENEKQKVDKLNQEDFNIQKIHFFKPSEINNLEIVNELNDNNGLYKSFKVIYEDKTMTKISFKIKPKQEINEIYERLNQIKNKSIDKVIGISDDDKSTETIFLFDYYENDLNHMVKNLENEDKIAIIFEIISALRDAKNSGISHLSLNTENIFIDSNKHAKIRDFGMLQCIYHDYSNDIKSLFPSSYTFIAPELLSNSVTNEEKVDVFSFGVVVYFILTNGEFPKLNDNKIDLTKMPDSMNQYSKRLINMCLNEKEENRPSIEDIYNSLSSDLDLIDDVDTDIIKNQLQI